MEKTITFNIPKGSIYYINADYIVSSDIIVTDKIVK